MKKGKEKYRTPVTSLAILVYIIQNTQIIISRLAGKNRLTRGLNRILN